MRSKIARRLPLFATTVLALSGFSLLVAVVYTASGKGGSYA
jgi:hypothetical protein